uniref:RIKEN cDNA 2900092C05 gene n=1 Tax=Nannospalax galili TaxID=1026970 RepID=A0A8C6QNS9_NANGA
MYKVQSSFMFLFCFLLKCLFHVCLSYTHGLYPVGKASLPGSHGQSQLLRSFSDKPRGLLSKIQSTRAPSQPTVSENFSFLGMIPRRSDLVQVITVACIAFSIALLSGLLIFYMIYRLVKAEEKQQLARLYENVEIPLIEEEGFDDSKDDSFHSHVENEELGKFISSVIRSKRRENILKK